LDSRFWTGAGDTAWPEDSPAGFRSLVGSGLAASSLAAGEPTALEGNCYLFGYIGSEFLTGAGDTAWPEDDSLVGFRSLLRSVLIPSSWTEGYSSGLGGACDFFCYVVSGFFTGVISSGQ